LNYNATIGKNHNISALAVYSEEYWEDRHLEASRLDRLHPSVRELDGALESNQTNRGFSSTEGLRSVIGRLNYVGYGKYLVEATFRYDGSSRFLPGNQYGFFPSAAVGWRFMEEDFMNNIVGRVISDGKFRVSYGSLGNNSGVGRFEQSERLTTNNYMVDGEIVKGFVYSQMVNRDLSWETTTVLNVGLDLGFLNNRLSAEFDYYDRLTSGMNRPSDLSILLRGAYAQPRRNLGNLRNRGVETTVTWRDRKGQFNYSFTLNASYNRSNLELWNEALFRGQQSGGSQVFLGMPINYAYYYDAIGIAQTWEDIYKATPQGASPGDILYRDVNGDGRIDENDRIADPRYQTDRPTTNFALNSNFAWKGFDLLLFFQGAAGRKDFWLNNYKNLNIGSARHASTWEYWENPWSLDNREGLWPRLNGNANMRESTFWLDDMSYIRIKSVQLGYNFPQSRLLPLKIRNLRVSFKD